MKNTVLYAVTKSRRLSTSLLLAALLASCSSGTKENADTSSNDTNADNEEFVADHDIAMTVSSLADAVSVGEKLRAKDYEYEGILTDGRGTPIYTDTDGAPGQWRVDVVDAHTATISNVKGGDIMPEYLIQYIINNTRISDTNRKPIEEEETESNADTLEQMLDIYTFEGGQISFKAKLAETKEGEIFNCLVITITSTHSPAS